MFAFVLNVSTAATDEEPRCASDADGSTLLPSCTLQTRQASTMGYISARAENATCQSYWQVDSAAGAPRPKHNRLRCSSKEHAWKPLRSSRCRAAIDIYRVTALQPIEASCHGGDVCGQSKKAQLMQPPLGWRRGSGGPRHTVPRHTIAAPAPQGP